MPGEKIDVYESKMEYTGVFPYREFYDFCREYLEDLNYQVAETKYKEGGSGSRDAEFEWIAYRKLSEHFKKNMKIIFVIYGMKDTEVEENGKKLTKKQGRIKILLDGDLIKDYKGKFEQSKFLKEKLRKAYNDWLIKSRIQELKSNLFKECDGFLTEAKNFLNSEGKR